MYNEQLYHHGILGQKWGVRRFQNKNGTLTPAGDKRYRTNLKRYGENLKMAVKSAKIFANTAKKELKDETINKRLKSQSESDKSQKRLKLEQHYKSKGLSDEEASVAAYKREKTEQIVANLAGVPILTALKTKRKSADKE